MLLLTLCACAPVVAQAAEVRGEIPAELLNKVVRVETVGGGTFQGELLGIADDRIELLGTDGLILQISRREVQSVEEMKPEGGGNLYFQDASSNRLIVIPTGFGMDKGEFHIADLEIVSVTASYGISESFSVWAGVSIPGVLVNARFSFSLANGFIGASVGSFAGISWMSFAEGGGLVIPYLLASFGTENQNLTVGAGTVFSFGAADPSGFFEYAAFVTVLGGKLPLSSTTAIITENWIIVPPPDSTFDYSPAVMFFPAVVFRIAGNRLSWDIGATYPFDVGSYGIRSTIGFPIPLLTLTYRIS
jgi:hypothetical protein